MKLNQYVKSRGLTATLVAQKMGVTRQAVDNYGNTTGKGYMPTARTLERIANAMTELGAPTTVVDLVEAIYQK